MKQHTDATSAAVLTGGGSLTIPVWYNGTVGLSLVLVDRLVLYRQKLLISTTVHLQAVV
jgi:hypothetical protein